MKITNKNVWTILISLALFLGFMAINFFGLNKISNDIPLSEKEYCFEVLKDYIIYHSDKKIKTLSFLSMI